VSGLRYPAWAQQCWESARHFLGLDSCFREKPSALAWCSDQPSRRARFPIRRCRNHCSEPPSKLLRAEQDIEQLLWCSQSLRSRDNPCHDQLGASTHSGPSSGPLTLSRKIPEVVVLRSVFVLLQHTCVATVADWPYPRPVSGLHFDALNVESIAVRIQPADNLHLLILILGGSALVIELVSRVVSHLQNVLFSLSHDDAGNARLGCLWLSRGIR
jgi:hypothetical protein